MTELGLFPLGIVLLPTEQVPLHIFEERYKELIGECLEEGREFGLVLADDDGLREVGTRAAVVSVLERFPDGRMNVVVEGRVRFRVVELTTGRSFQTAAVAELEDEPGEPEPAAVEQAQALLRRVAGLAGAELAELGSSSFELAARVELDAVLKQKLLELRSEPTRLREVTTVLKSAARSLELVQERDRIARLDGKPGGAASGAD